MAISAHPSAKRNTQSRAWLAVVIGVIAISFAAIFFRKASPTHPVIAAAVRLGLSSLMLSPWVIRAFRRRTLRPIHLRAASIGSILYAVHFGAWVTSLTMTSIAASVTVVTATPVLLMLVSWVTKRDRPDAHHYAAMGLAMVGLGLIGSIDMSLSSQALLGDFWALVGCAGMAGYLLLIRSLGNSLDVIAFSGLTCFGASALLLIGALLFGIPIEVSTNEAWFYLFLAAAIPQLIGHNCLAWSLRHLRPTVVGLATVGEPVGSTLLAWFWLNEPPPMLILLGCGITLSSVLLTGWKPKSA